MYRFMQTLCGLLLSFVVCGFVSGQASNETKYISALIEIGPSDLNNLLLDMQVKQFEEAFKHENVKVKVLNPYLFFTGTSSFLSQRFETIKTILPIFDIVQLDVIWTGDLASELLDLNQFPGIPEVSRQHFNTIIKNNSPQYRLVGLPFFADAGMLYFRKDLLRKYNFITPPQTWDELEQQARTIQEGERSEGKTDFWGFVWQGRAYEGLTTNALEWITSNNGGTIISPDKVININNPNAIEILARVASWVGTISPPQVVDFDEEGSRALWQSGNAAFMRNWPYAYPLTQSAAWVDQSSPIVNSYDVTLIPRGITGTSASCLGGWQLAVSKYSRWPTLAIEFMKFITGYYGQKSRALFASLNPTISQLYNDEEVVSSSVLFSRLQSILSRIVARPSTQSAPKYNNVTVIFFTEVSKILRGLQTAEAGAQAMEQQLIQLLAYPTSNVV